MTSTVSIVLAAGKGMRLGGPKALLLWPGPPGQKPRPLAIAHAEARLSAESSRVVVVARSAEERVIIRHSGPGIVHRGRFMFDRRQCLREIVRPGDEDFEP